MPRFTIDRTRILRKSAAKTWDLRTRLVGEGMGARGEPQGDFRIDRDIVGLAGQASQLSACRRGVSLDAFQGRHGFARKPGLGRPVRQGLKDGARVRRADILQNFERSTLLPALGCCELGDMRQKGGGSAKRSFAEVRSVGRIISQMASGA